ncbi:hypothetical protein Tco_0356001 [Tanacetum coccineum]
MSADDNIISDDLDIALELGKSISNTEAEEVEAAKQVHATHARIMTEFVPKPTRRRKSSKVTSDPPKKLKGVPSLTLEEQEAANTMHALKESRNTSRRQPGTGGSSEGTSTIPGVPDESAVISATLSEGTEDQLDDEEKDDKEVDADDEGDDHISDTQDTDDEDDETESDEDKIYKYNIRVHKDEDEEMLNAKVEYFGKGDEEVSDAAKADAEKTEEAKDDSKEAKLPLTSSSLSISSGFGDQFHKLSSNTSLVGTVKDTTDAEISSLMDIKIQSELRVANLEKDVSELMKIDLSAEALVALKTQVPSLIDNYLGSKQIPKLPKNQTPTVDLEQEYEKSPLEILKIKKKQAEKQRC